ncbi:MAG: FAD-dependent oxidoreductase [Candidatus Helarchaeota archaeon]
MDKVGAVLVIGGGIAGTQASLDLADSGFKVYIVEQTTSIGGVMAQLDKTFPTNDCAMCIVSPKLVAAGRHHNIDIIANARVTGCTGSAGNFTVTLLRKSCYIDWDKCTGCGVCGQYCPMEAIDAFNEGLSVLKATSVKYPQAVPLKYAINLEKCIGCGVCEGVCKAGAIDYTQEDQEVTLNVGAIILAPGFDEFDPSNLVNYGYGTFQNVVTSIQFERILSASGPYGGLVLRPSDGDIPDKVAFLQCIGSRDITHGKEYCSSVCCMYTCKEAVIAKEHQHQVHPTIFSMDVRSFGKDFDKYIERAKDEYGVRYVRRRVAFIEEEPDTNDLLLYYEGPDGKLVEEMFNMVVLAVGLNPPKLSAELAQILNVELDEYGFAKNDPFKPVDTNVPGIYVCGAFNSPKDIPETVTEASAAAGRVDALLAEVRGTKTTAKELPPEINVSGEPPRIGCFICHCGINIGGVVDVPSVVEYAKSLPNVAYAANNLYTCSADTQGIIKDDIKAHNLNRVIVASCTPRTHEPLFQGTIREAGLNRYLFEMANIRDQCSWVHMHEPEAATEKAKELVKMAVAKANKIEPLERIKLNMTKKAMVIGGGVAGMTAALGFADQGYETYLLEKEKELGGFSKNIHITLEGNDVQQFVKDLTQKVENNNLIHVYKSVQIRAINGYIGNFISTIEHGENKELVEFEHGVVVVATGASQYQPKEYYYGEDERVLTQNELENRLFSNPRLENVKSIVMLQCVGSRNEEHPYCCRIGCIEAIKNALKVKELNPDTEVTILFRDIRTYGLREKYYRLAREAGVLFILYDNDKPPELVKDGEKLKITVDSPDSGPLSLEADLFVLTAGIQSLESNDILAPMLKVPLNDDGFFLEAHMKLRPVDFATEGVFLCGLAHAPKGIEESIGQALATVSRATTYLTKENIEAEGVTAVVRPLRCTGCGLCELVCPYNAISVQEVERLGRIAVVNSALCKGCGTCSANCRCSAVDLLGFTNEQIALIINSRRY